MLRLAFIVSHPIQYYVPLYQRLGRRDDLAIRVFFTWHAGQTEMHDYGFKKVVAWDIPLTEGYDCESIPNVSSNPGTHRFFGLRNPSLIQRVMAWHPSAVHITGWAWFSHLLALRALARHRIPVLFRGDSHLLDSDRHGLRWWLKRAVLMRVFSWPAGFLFVGMANRAYYEAFGIEPARLCACPHSIDVARFAGRADVLEQEAARWREDLGIAGGRRVLLFAGKFERKKRPVELMRAVQALGDPSLVLVLAGGGELVEEVNAIAASDPERFRVLPFQNQSRMPVVYRLGDVFVLPSSHGETWGLAVNEAMACGRPALVSDRVGCAADLMDPSSGRVFPWADSAAMIQAIQDMIADRQKLVEMGRAAAQRAWMYDIARTEAALMTCLLRVCAP
jgi:glycosyltransferase involved in cell wall biosynthesis